MPADQRNAPVAAKEGLDFCNQLFAIEREYLNATPDERYKARLEHSRPVLEAFLAWLKYQGPRVLPKSAFGQAITYCRNQWEKLAAFLQDGRLELDNNRGERSIKPFVIGRKNWLFSNTPKGAKASATIYSIVESAKENGLNPYSYLQYLFERLPNIDIHDQSALDELLPWSSTLPSECRIQNKINNSRPANCKVGFILRLPLSTRHPDIENCYLALPTKRRKLFLIMTAFFRASRHSSVLICVAKAQPTTSL